MGVSSCQDVLHLYRLLWASAVLNVLGLFLGIVTAAVLGAFKDMVSCARPALGGLSDGKGREATRRAASLRVWLQEGAWSPAPEGLPPPRCTEAPELTLVGLGLRPELPKLG